MGVLEDKVKIPTCASLFPAGLHVPYRRDFPRVRDRMQGLTVTITLALESRQDTSLPSVLYLTPSVCLNIQPLWSVTCNGNPLSKDVPELKSSPRFHPSQERHEALLPTPMESRSFVLFFFNMALSYRPSGGGRCQRRGILYT